MCVIIYCRNSQRPIDEVLHTANKNNGDGIGFSRLDGDKVYFEKGISMERLFELIHNPPNEYVIHFRKTTVGGTSDELCHPFPVTQTAHLNLNGETDAVLFHNGTFKTWAAELRLLSLSDPNVYIPGEMWSDSRAVAKMVAHKGTSFLNLITYENEDRFLVMDAKAKEKVRRFGTWFKYANERLIGERIEDDKGEDTYNEDILFSNKYWDGSKKK